MEQDMEIIFKEVFKAVQMTTTKHQKFYQTLKQLYMKNDHDEFFNMFVKYLYQFLLWDYNVDSPFVEKALDFCSMFTCTLKNFDAVDEFCEESEFVFDVIYFLLEEQCMANDNIRFNACKMLNKIMNGLVGYNLSCDLCDYIMECMLERTEDGITAVRLQSINVLRRLQDVADPENPIINKFEELMLHDKNVKVRALATEQIMFTRKKAPSFLLKLRDIDVSVRMAALKRVGKTPNHFQIHERQLIILTAHSDAEPIQKYLTEMVFPAWLEHYNFDYISLISKLALNADEIEYLQTEDILKIVLEALFEQRPNYELLTVLRLNEQRVIPLEELNWNKMVFWYHLVNYMRTDLQYEEVLNEILPEIKDFCEYVKQFCVNISNDDPEKELDSQFILKLMVLVISGYDFADVGMRNHCVQFIVHIFNHFYVHEEVLKVVFLALDKVIPNINEQIEFVCGVISDMLASAQEINEDSSQADDINAQRTERNVRSLGKHLHCIPFEEAWNIQFAVYHTPRQQTDLQTEDILANEKDIVNCNPEVLSKCLRILWAILGRPQVFEITAKLKMLQSALVQPLLYHHDTRVSIEALKCYSLFCTRDQRSAMVGIQVLAPQLLAINENEDDIVKIKTLMSGVGDMLVVFGTSLLSAKCEENLDEDLHHTLNLTLVFKETVSLSTVLKRYMKLMDCDDEDIQEMAVMVLINLICSGRVCSFHLLSRLIIRWSLPGEVDDINVQKIKQRIGNMLENLPMVLNSAEQLEDAFIVTIKTLVTAPQSSPLNDINIENLVKFILQLCKSYETKNINLHVNLARKIQCEIMKNPKSKATPIYINTLSSLCLPTDNKDVFNELIDLYNLLRDVISNSRLIQAIVKFIAHLHCLRDSIGRPIRPDQSNQSNEAEDEEL